MNGRCETDPLDRAVDVCDSCYGEFCEACLTHPKGRRHPVCTECALSASGVRTDGQPKRRGSKRSAKRRRAELRARPDEEEAVFRFFDADQEVEPVPDGDEQSRKRRKRGKDRDSSEPAEAERADEHEDEGDIEPHQTDEAATMVTPAVAKLEELRKEKPEVVDAEVEEVVVDQDAELEPTDVAAEEGADETADLEPAATEPDPTNSETDEVEEPALQVDPEPAATPARRKEDQPEAEPGPATAPMIGEVRTIGGRRITDDHQPAPASPDEVVADVPATAAKRNAVEEFDADRPRADTDAQGNWVPPILRGMAPDARANKAGLPQRRRKGED